MTLADCSSQRVYGAGRYDAPPNGSRTIGRGSRCSRDWQGLSILGEAYVRPSKQTNHIGARLVAWTVNYGLPIPKTQKEIASDRL